jgi:hypothetical protein
MTEEDQYNGGKDKDSGRRTRQRRKKNKGKKRIRIRKGKITRRDRGQRIKTTASLWL